MGAADVFQLFARPTESLSKQIYRKASYQSPWLNVVPRSTFAGGTGLTQTTFSIANIEPTTHDEVWSAITLASDVGGSGGCAASFTAVETGFNAVSYAPEQYGLIGPVLCKEDPIYEHNAAAFLAGYIQELAKRAQRSWENRYESIYKQFATKAVVPSATGNPVYANGLSKFWTGSNGALSGSSVVSLNGGVAAGAPLNQDHLDHAAYELIQRGATSPDSNGWIELSSDGPVFSLLISPEASKRIMKEDTSSGVRTDIRYGAPSELLKRMGATRTLNNFRHVPNIFPARYGFGQTVASCVTNTTSGTEKNVTCVTTDAFRGICVGMPVTGTGIAANSTVTAIAADYKSFTLSANATAAGTVTLTFGTVGQYFRCQTFETISATKGKQAVVTTGWKNAPCEEAIVITPYVFTSEIVRPVNSLASVTWNPTDNMGEWQWVLGANNFDASVTDPLKKRGAHVCEFRHAPRPVFPEYGMTFIFRRY